MSFVRGSSKPSTSAQARAPQKPPSGSKPPSSSGYSATLKRPRREQDRSPSPIHDITDEDDEVLRRPIVGKGKAREDPIELDAEESQRQQPVKPPSKGVTKAGGLNGTEKSRLTAAEKELEQLRLRLEQAETTRDTYKNQLQAVLEQRMTEPEQLAKEREAWFEERHRVDEELIAELRAATGIQEGGFLPQSDNSEAMIELQNQVEQLKADNLRHQDIIKQLRTELRSARSAPQPPPSATKTSRAEANHASQGVVKDNTGEVIALYEQMTGLIIIDMKKERPTVGDTPDQEELFQCMVSAEGRSVSFKLRFFKRIPESRGSPNVSMSAEPMIAYTPTSTAQETDADLLASLEYYSDDFQFLPEQLPAFLRGLVDRISGREDE